MRRTFGLTLLVALTGGVVAVPAILALILGWPVWLWPFLALVLLVIPFQVRRSMLIRVQQDELLRQFAMPPVVPAPAVAPPELEQAPPPPQFPSPPRGR